MDNNRPPSGKMNSSESPTDRRCASSVGNVRMPAIQIRRNEESFRWYHAIRMATDRLFGPRINYSN